MNASEHRPEYEELLALYALGALGGDELRQLEAHLRQGCTVCRRQLAERRGETAALAEAVEEVMPSPESRRELLRRLEFETTGHGYAVIGDAEPAARRGASARGADDSEEEGGGAPWGWRLAAMLLLAAGLGVFFWARAVEVGLHDEIAAGERRAAGLVAQLEQQEAEIALLSNRLAATERALATVATADQVELAGLGSGGSARGRLYAGESGLLVVVDGLPAPPAERVYQLWRIAEGRPVSAGLLESADGTAFLWTGTVGVEEAVAREAEVWAVTLEPAGGVVQPTGEVVLSS